MIVDLGKVKPVISEPVFISKTAVKRATQMPGNKDNCRRVGF